MAWHRGSIKKYLADQEIDPAVMSAIEERMAKIADSKGFFSGGELVNVMGNQQLADAYCFAWENDPQYAARNFT